MIAAGLSPLASISATSCTGMRVPLKTGVPPSTSGALDTFPRALLSWLSPERTARAAGRVYNNQVGAYHRLSRQPDGRRHDRAPAPKCEHVRRFMRQFEADESL